ncbi:MAG TPA: hypothetical protein VF310_03430, partial [Vicinamibacteria bacterium]
MKQREQALAAVAAALGAAVEQGGSNRFFTLPGEGAAPIHVGLRPYGPVGVYVSTSRRPGEPYELLSERSHRLSLSPSSPRARLARAVFFPWRRTGDGDFDREVHVQSSLPWRRCAAFLAAGETRAAVRTLL